MALLAIASVPSSNDGKQDSLRILRLWNENIKCVFIDSRVKISADKSKQTSTFLEILNSNELSFWASAYLFKFINQWGPRNVARAPKILFYTVGAQRAPKKLS